MKKTIEEMKEIIEYSIKRIAIYESAAKGALEEYNASIEAINEYRDNIENLEALIESGEETVDLSPLL